MGEGHQVSRRCIILCLRYITSYNSTLVYICHSHKKLLILISKTQIDRDAEDAAAALCTAVPDIIYYHVCGHGRVEVWSVGGLGRTGKKKTLRVPTTININNWYQLPAIWYDSEQALRISGHLNYPTLVLFMLYLLLFTWYNQYTLLQACKGGGKAVLVMDATAAAAVAATIAGLLQLIIYFTPGTLVFK